MLFIRRYSQNLSFYDILGVKPSSSQEEIKTAFYVKSKMYHPDVMGAVTHDKEYKSISLAYNTLSNASNRKAYDLQHNFNTQSYADNYLDKSDYFWSNSACLFR